ncbi:MAG: hypothetical protein RL434_1398 [Pseudomonadota bacterium]
MSFRRRMQARLPGKEAVAKHRVLRWLGNRLHDPNLWHFGRRSVSRGAGIGMVVAFFPIPVQMTVVAPIAIAFGLNLPVMLAAVWVTNPITWIPIFYFAYRVGVFFLHGDVLPLEALNLSADFGNLQSALGEIWAPLFLGSAICGSVLGVLTYSIIELAWRFNVARRWRRREGSRHRTSAP